jgi:hypothetical protein
MNRLNRWMAHLVAVCLSFAGFLLPAQAALVSTEQVAAQQGFVGASPRGLVDTAAQRDFVNATLARADVAGALQARGVSVEQAAERVAALSDAEVAALAHNIDAAPAGADVLGILFTVFIVLLITDILGLTKVFPFTRSAR